jgi:hypothetical protein
LTILVFAMHDCFRKRRQRRTAMNQGKSRMWRWMMGLLRSRERGLPLAKRDLLEHAHVDLLPTRWTRDNDPAGAGWTTERADMPPEQRRAEAEFEARLLQGSGA